MATTEKYVTLFNFLSNLYDVAYTSARFQRVLIQDTTIDVHQGTITDNSGSVTKELPLTKESFAKIFQQSSAVIIQDSMFTQESFLVETAAFFDHGGLEALVEYFQQGGTVIVHVVEGIYAIGDILSKQFGCQWKLQAIESSAVVVTDRGRQLLGEMNCIREMTLHGKAHFMRAPQVEALISKKVYNKEEFVNQYDPDSDDEDAYPRYRRGEEGQHVMCVYEGFGSEGKLIWNGDRGQNDVMKAAFEGLLKL